MTIELAEEGLLEPYESATTATWPGEWRDAQNHWYGFAGRARVIVYSPSRISASQVPQTWMELCQSRFHDKIVMADPRFGTTGGHLGAMKLHWDRKVMPGYYDAWLEGLAANNIRLLPSGNAGVVEAVANGEADVGMTDTDDVWAAQARGLDVDLVYARHSIEPGENGAGTLVIPNTASIIKGGPNPAHAKLRMEFLLSERLERMLADSASRNIPSRPTLAVEFPQLAVPDPLRVDLKVAATMRDTAVRSAMSILSKREPVSQPAMTVPSASPEARN